MSKEWLAAAEAAFELGDQFDIDVAADMAADERRHPQLVRNADGSPEQEIEVKGAAYNFAQIDYRDVAYPGRVLAQRMVAIISPGDRTELAFWSPLAPTKLLDIHQGTGQLISRRLLNRGVNSMELDAASRTEVGIHPDSFYTLVADESSETPLVVSGLFEPPVVDWNELEATFGPQDEVTTILLEAPVGSRVDAEHPRGKQYEVPVRTPEDFRETFAA